MDTCVNVGKHTGADTRVRLMFEDFREIASTMVKDARSIAPHMAIGAHSGFGCVHIDIVFVCGFGGLFLSCVCVSVSRCVCVCVRVRVRVRVRCVCVRVYVRICVRRAT